MSNCFSLQSLLPKEPNIANDEKIKEWQEFFGGVLKNYTFDDKNKEMFEKISHYLALRNCKEKGFTNLNAGLLIMGSVGTGKTLAMNIMSGIFKINIATSQELAREYAIGGDAGFADYVNDLKYKELIIDDIGSERDIKHFGNAGIIGEFITQRYELWVNDKVLTHITTNISKTDFIERYGERNWSRICEMCKTYIVTDKQDRRRL
jgi:DNA replication protein DnaC